jgi:hypothetical protein
MRIFSEHVNNDNLICYGDILWIHHLESDSILVTLKNTTDDIVINLQSQSSDHVKEFNGNTNGMWYIENDDLK